MTNPFKKTEASCRPERLGLTEVFVMRALFALVVWWSMPGIEHVRAYTKQSSPTGLAEVFPLTWIAIPGVYEVMLGLLTGALVLYAVGIWLQISLPVAAMIHILVLTLYHSQGAAHHSYHLVSLVLLAQWLTYWAPGIYRLVKKRPLILPGGIRLSDLSIYYAQHMIAAAYVIAGVTKLIRSKGMWIFQTPNLSVELLKTNAQNYYSKLATDETYEQRQHIAQWLIDNPNLTRIMMAGGLFIEVFALLALRNRFCLLVGGVLILAMHLGIDLFMGLSFKYNIAVVAIFYVNPVFWIFRASQKAGSPGDLRQLSADFPWRSAPPPPPAQPQRSVES